MILLPMRSLWFLWLDDFLNLSYTYVRVIFLLLEPKPILFWVCLGFISDNGYLSMS